MWLKRRDLKLLLVMALLSLRGFHIFLFFYCVFVYRHKACESFHYYFLEKNTKNKMIINLRFRNLQSVVIMFSTSLLPAVTREMNKTHFNKLFRSTLNSSEWMIGIALKYSRRGAV